MYEYKTVQGITFTNFFPSSNFTRSEVNIELNAVFVPDHVKKKSSNFGDYVRKWDIDNS